MDIEEFRKAAQEGREAAFLAYLEAYDFEPRWNRRDTIIYSVIAGGLAIMTVMALL